MKLSKEKQQQLVLVGIMTGAVIALLYFMVIQGQKERIQAMGTQLTDEEQRVDKARRTVKLYDQRLAELDSLSQELRNIEDTMASGDLYLWSVQTINRIRARHRVEIPEFGRPNDEKTTLLPDFPYRSATFSVRGKAYYHDFGKFLADLENSFPYMRVQKLKLEPAAPPPSNTGSSSNARSGRAESTAGPLEKLQFEMEVVALIHKATP